MGPFLRFASRPKLTLGLAIKGHHAPTIPPPIHCCARRFFNLEPFIVSSYRAARLSEADRFGHREHATPHLYSSRPFPDHQTQYIITSSEGEVLLGTWLKSRVHLKDVSFAEAFTRMIPPDDKGETVLLTTGEANC